MKQNSKNYKANHIKTETDEFDLAHNIKVKTRVKSELYANRHYLLFAFFISALSILPQLIISPNSSHFTFLVIAGVFLITLAKFSKAIFAIFVLFVNFSNMIILHIAMHWGYEKADLKPRIEIALLSPNFEQSEYLHNYIGYADYALALFTIFNITLLFWFLKNSSHSLKIFKAIGAALATLTIFAYAYYVDHEREGEPFTLVEKVTDTISDKEALEAALKQRAVFLANNKRTPSAPNHLIYDKIVIIMGESANKNHMSLYGYGAKTTPFLDNLSKSKNFYKLNAIAPTNQTRFSIPIDLTDATAKVYEKRFLRSSSLIGDLRANGYKSYWVSNQGALGKHDSVIASMSSEADEAFFANLNYEYAKTDDLLIGEIAARANRDKKELFFIHLMGSHADYENRYKKDDALYKEPQNIIQEYDNTIHFSDRVIAGIYEIFKDKKVLFVYLADHGENISLENNGHGFLPPYKDEYEVPFVLYSSIKNQRLERLKRANSRAEFNLENFKQLVLYASGVATNPIVSYSKSVMAVDTTNIYDYRKLERFR